MAKVQTKLGIVEGIEKDGLRVFLGIPYAMPPTGERRFRPPEPVKAWTGIKSAKSYGSTVPQSTSPTSIAWIFEATEPAGDDCLNLNVWTPASAGTMSRLPVFFWIHGGGFQMGAGCDPMYAGTAFAHDGIVTITINYRLGIQGNLMVDGVEGAGNFGMLDQICALQWVRDNIMAFGGDPENVTIAGESAGGQSVGILLAMPRAKGLFRRAIVQSGAAHNAISRSSGLAITRRIAEEVGVSADDIEALRKVPLDKLLAAEKVILNRSLARQEPSFGELMLAALPLASLPVFGTPELPELPINAIRKGASVDVDLVVGVCEKESLGTMRLSPEMFGEYGNNLPSSTIEAIATLALSKDEALTAIDQYRHNRPEANNIEIFAALFSDWSFIMPALRLAEAHADYGTTYMFQISWKSPGGDGKWDASHTLDIPLLFDTCDSDHGRYITGEAAPRELIHAVHGAWVSFVRGDSPPAVPFLDKTHLLWPVFNTKQRETMFFDVPPSIQLDPRKSERLLWVGKL
ncbi:hypothetical protein B7463_g8796, partial [Scytalidium lignicola]